MAVIGIVGDSLGMHGKLAALGAMKRGGERHLHTEFVRSMCLALADTFDLGCMQAIDLAAALMAFLIKNPTCQMQRLPEDGLELVLACDLPANVTDRAPEIGL